LEGAENKRNLPQPRATMFGIAFALLVAGVVIRSNGTRRGRHDERWQGRPRSSSNLARVMFLRTPDRERTSASLDHMEWRTIMSTAVNKRDVQMSGLIERVRVNQQKLTDELEPHYDHSLVSFISHDLRHLLTTVYCNVEFMSEPGIGQTDREQLLADVRESIHGMTDLLDSLLLFVRTGKALHLQQGSLNLLIQRAVSMVRSHPDARGVELVTRAAQAVDVSIDSQQLGTAVYNLLLNACQALKHCHPPKRVDIALCRDESFINIRVEDNGQGVSDRIRDLFLQPFVSAEKSNGVGLGLRIAVQAARGHGGGLYLEQSRPGRTVFVMHFPRLALETQIAEDTSENLKVHRSIASTG
jgi:signal transduction histidine kinase